MVHPSPPLQATSKPVQQTSNPLQVVLLGKTGAGKSATGNTILGQKDFVSKKSSKSVTANIEKQNVTIEGRDLVVYDTPGFCNTDQSKEQIQEKFQDVLKLTSSGPRVFLLVVKIDRLTEEEKRVISKVEDLLGESLLKQTWILFTRRDELEDQTIEELIADSDEVTEVMRKYGGRYHVFNNKSGDPEQVKSLLEKTSICLNSTVSRGSSIRNLPERRIVLLGKSSVGKSATGNTILGRNSFISKKSSKSVTADIEKQNVTIEGRDLVVYDTPGFCNTDQSKEQIQEKFQDVLKLTSSGPCVFLLVVKIDRLTEEEMRVISKVEDLLGESLLKQTWILFTRGDELEDQTIEQFIADSDDLTEVMRKYGGRYHVFNNKSGDPEQVKTLLEKTSICLNSTLSGGGEDPEGGGEGPEGEGEDPEGDRGEDPEGGGGEDPEGDRGEDPEGGGGEDPEGGGGEDPEGGGGEDPEGGGEDPEGDRGEDPEGGGGEDPEGGGGEDPEGGGGEDPEGGGGEDPEGGEGEDPEGEDREGDKGVGEEDGEVKAK